MKRYNHSALEKKWQKIWSQKKVYRTKDSTSQKKCYVLDMFPYPSGKGLHVGHPKGYIGSDVYARFKRMQGFNVLHPMGYDAFGLPAEQYAVEHNVHPRTAVLKNIQTFEKQLSIIGLSYDWDRKINTTDPAYYKWTQWIFLELYNSWFDTQKQKARPIEELIKIFNTKGSSGAFASCDKNLSFTHTEWKAYSDKEKQDVLMNYRLAYEGYSEVNWCQELGTVLANDEIVDGPNGPVSERGGYPVVKKEMRQWFLRITAYADRLLSGLDQVSWSEHIKDIERNWIGRSEGFEFSFTVEAHDRKEIGTVPVFTTRIDTIYGVSCIVLAPEHEYVRAWLPYIHNRQEVEEYIQKTKESDDVVRKDANKEKTGVHLSGLYAVHPLTKEQIPVYIADYVLASYGTGAVMAVPAHDERDFAFAQKYNLPIQEVVLPNIIDKRNPPVSGKKTVARRSVHPIVYNPKRDKYLGLQWKQFDWVTFPMGGIEEGEDPVAAARREVAEETGYTNLKLIKVLDGQARAEYFAAHKDQNRVSFTTAVLFELVDETRQEVSDEEMKQHEVIWIPKAHLDYEHMTHAETEIWRQKMEADHGAYTGEGVLINSGEFSEMYSEEARERIAHKVGAKKVVTYKMRNAVFARQRYWGEPIPLYRDAKGIIHEVTKLPLTLPQVKSYKPTGTGESPLASVPAWTKKGYETNTMPGWAGSSWYFLRYMDPRNAKAFASKKSLSYWKQVDMYVGGQEHATGHVLYARFWHKFLKDKGLVSSEEPFKVWRTQGMILGSDNRKMSKRWGNVINPDDIVTTYGADTLRVYEMFMGPFEASLPWNTESIIGSRRFVERVWRLYEKVKKQVKEKPYEYTLHDAIRRVTQDIESFSFNTAVSACMIALNDMEKSEAVAQKDFELFLKIISPFAPHVTSELWALCGHKTHIVTEKWPTYDPKKLIKQEVTVVIQINGKVRGEITVPSQSAESVVKEKALALEQIQKWVGSSEIRRVIYVQDKLLNIVI